MVTRAQLNKKLPPCPGDDGKFSLNLGHESWNVSKDDELIPAPLCIRHSGPPESPVLPWRSFRRHDQNPWESTGAQSLCHNYSEPSFACYACKLPLLGPTRYLVEVGAFMHDMCVECCICSTLLTSNKIRMIQGRLFCRNHFVSKLVEEFIGARDTSKAHGFVIDDSASKRSNSLRCHCCKKQAVICALIEGRSHCLRCTLPLEKN